jgi:hypothetical protein
MWQNPERAERLQVETITSAYPYTPLTQHSRILAISQQRGRPYTRLREVMRTHGNNGETNKNREVRGRGPARVGTCEKERVYNECRPFAHPVLAT